MKWKRVESCIQLKQVLLTLLQRGQARKKFNDAPKTTEYGIYQYFFILIYQYCYCLWMKYVHLWSDNYKIYSNQRDNGDLYCSQLLILWYTVFYRSPYDPFFFQTSYTSLTRTFTSGDFASNVVRGETLSSSAVQGFTLLGILKAKLYVSLSYVEIHRPLFQLSSWRHGMRKQQYLSWPRNIARVRLLLSTRSETQSTIEL